MAPKGQSTRPTADRVRQALFDVLEHAAWSPPLAGARVVDLFAGSGALGLEALSRGAAFCLFADADPSAIAAILTNLGALGLARRGAARGWDATRLGARQGQRPAGEDAERHPAFDFAFLDPPYARGLTDAALHALREGGWLTPEAVAVVERGAGEPEPAAAGYAVVDSRAWGAARVWFLRLHEGPPPCRPSVGAAASAPSVRSSAGPVPHEGGGERGGRVGILLPPAWGIRRRS